MNLPHRSHYIHLVLFDLFASVCAGNVTFARVGEDAILPCQFIEGPIDGMIVEWTLHDPVRVAYSYYEGAAQDAEQHLQFRGRTAVNESRLARGEASLRLRSVTPRDEGRYSCFFRLAVGMRKVWPRLEVAAPYTEPEVSCSPADPSLDPPTINLTCQAMGGFPRSEVRWQWSNGSWYSGEAENLWMQEANGSFSLRSWLEVQPGEALELRCLVKNERLNQTSASRETCSDNLALDTDSGTASGSTCPLACQSHPEGSPTQSRVRFGLVGTAAVILVGFLLLVCLPPRRRRFRV